MEVDGWIPAADGPIFGIENEKRAAGKIMCFDHELSGSVKYETGWRGWTFSSLRRRNCDHQRHNRSGAGVKRGKTGAVVSDPNRAGCAEVESPGVDQVGVLYCGPSSQVGDEIGLHILVCWSDARKCEAGYDRQQASSERGARGCVHDRSPGT